MLYHLYKYNNMCDHMCVCCVCGAWCDLVLAMLFKNQTSVNPLIKSNHSKIISKINIVTHMGPMAYNAYTVCIYIYIYIYLHISNHIKYSRINPKLYPSDTNRSR